MITCTLRDKKYSIDFVSGRALRELEPAAQMYAKVVRLSELAANRTFDCLQSAFGRPSIPFRWIFSALGSIRIWDIAAVSHMYVLCLMRLLLCRAVLGGPVCVQIHRA